MGVPFFYSWIVKRYPFIKQEILKNMPYIDCLYMDLNCIIYKCVKDEGSFLKEFISAAQFDEIWVTILNALNELINLIQPRKLLFLTFDGVAPRAKMNHQRNRRFKSAKSHTATKNLTQNLSNSGGMEFGEETFINNSISPGTHFMTELNKAMKFFIQRKLHEDDKWKHLKVVYSGSDVAGEGEHKIFDYIRKMKEKKGFLDSDTHCIYGNDADLIMLSLCSHLKNIVILRETFVFKKKFNRGAKRFKEEVFFEFVNINVLRDCLEIEFRDVKKKMEKNKFALGNVIDDFIFICFFVGNDFVPKMFCFDIRKGYLDKLLDLFKQFLIETNGYLIKNAKINFVNFEKLVKKLANWELELIGDKVKHSREAIDTNKFQESSESEDETVEFKAENEEMKTETKKEEPKTDFKDKSNLANKRGLLKNLDFMENFFKKYQENHLHAKSFYYETKLKFSSGDKEGLMKIAELIKKYIEGIQFVLLYYYEGCPSWSWFYPYYYAPMISDVYEYLKFMNQMNMGHFEFQLGTPFPAFKQLLLIMPQGSIDLLPTEYGHLITNVDSILRNPIDYYPTEFEIDPNDAYFESEFIAILPFLEDDLLEKAFASVDRSLMSEEVKERCMIGKNQEFSFWRKGNKITVKAFLPKYCDNFEGKINIIEFFIHEIGEGKFITKFNPDPNEQKMRDNCKFRLPTLKFLPHLSGKLSKNSRRPLNDSLSVKIPDKNIKEEECYMLLKNNVNFVYPMMGDRFTLFDGEVVGFMNQNILHSIKNLQYFQDHKYYDKRYHAEIFKRLCNETMFELDKTDYKVKKGFNFSTLFFIHSKFYYGRKNNGDFTFENHEYIVPIQLINQPKLWPYYDEIIAPKPNQPASLIGSKVLILKHPLYVGYFGKVTGFDEKNLEKLKVKIQKIASNAIVLQSEKNPKPNNYIPLKDICIILNIKVHTALTILDSLRVNLDQKSELFEKFGAQIDIGLNLINQQTLKIVPELVICKKLEQGWQPDRGYFEVLEFSKEALDMMKNYQEKFPKVMAFINNSKSPKSQYNASDFDKGPLDPNIEIIKIYVWLVKQNTSSLAQVPINSKVLSRNDVELMEKVIVKKPIKVEKTEIEINANHVFVENHHCYIPPYYRDHPPYHKLKDRVISLNTKGLNFPPFGSVGTVVGVLNMKVEVLFDEPFLGGNNLGGRCSFWRGCLMEFLDVFNLTRWGECLEERKSNNKGKGWDYYVKPYIPKFYARIINANQMNNYQNFDPYFNPYDALQNQGPLPQNLKTRSQEESKHNVNPGNILSHSEGMNKICQESLKTKSQEENNKNIINPGNILSNSEGGINKEELAKQLLFCVKHEETKEETKLNENDKNPTILSNPKKLLKLQSQEFQPSPDK